MNKVPENVTVETQSHQKPSKMRWLAASRAFLQIPNPAIVKVFVLSSLTTFTSGIALVIEWICHGKSHSGFGWIIYYALFLMCLPLLILIGFHILMAISSSSRSSKVQIVDTASSKEPCVVQQNQCTVTNIQQTEETEKNSCRSLAVVVPSDNEKMPRIKRAVSFPSRGEVSSCRTR
ncbi:PREDICTED: uncharacterized protein LOC104713567 [Camelina sativa]|uniref:Uncharacterized protein LOC104713567 n=1 Tax=Camelina sativa TaxID=90675 RepID=A0ABM0TNQ2_CAMSA|nr:PREDICTED: uncharacterized protein LOC104713567 [Camelina sativa]